MSELLCFVLSLIGIVALLYFLLFRLLMWGEKGGVLVVPLYPSEREPGTRIRNLCKLLELTGFDRIVTLVVAGHGVPPSVLGNLKEAFKNDERVFICDSEEQYGFLEALARRHE